MSTRAIPENAPAAALANLQTISNPQAGHPSKVEDAARQFEALLIDQMLRTAKETDDEHPEGDDDSSSSTMLDIANQQFSQLLANNGGLGLAKLIVQGLHRGDEHADQQRSARVSK